MGFPLSRIGTRLARQSGRFFRQKPFYHTRLEEKRGNFRSPPFKPARGRSTPVIQTEVILLQTELPLQSLLTAGPAVRYDKGTTIE